MKSSVQKRICCFPFQPTWVTKLGVRRVLTEHGKDLRPHQLLDLSPQRAPGAGETVEGRAPSQPGFHPWYPVWSPELCQEVAPRGGLQTKAIARALFSFAYYL